MRSYDTESSARRSHRRDQEPYTKEGQTSPEVIAEIRGCQGSVLLPSLNARSGSVCFLAHRAAPTFQPLRNVPLAGVVEKLISQHLVQDTKDRNALLWGNCVEGRCNGNMQSIEALPFDCDGTISIEAASARIKDKKLTALLYTTYSHGKTTTTVAVDKYRAYAAAKALPFPPTREAMLEYLRARRLGHLCDIDFDLSIANLSKHILMGTETFYIV
ncbi:MAG: hypothetical protein JSR78_09225, partial [Proteobacteria bacterium]|nr:hypothetical protein [Pseudomonadota bacterium]